MDRILINQFSFDKIFIATELLKSELADKSHEIGAIFSEKK